MKKTIEVYTEELVDIAFISLVALSIFYAIIHAIGAMI